VTSRAALTAARRVVVKVGSRLLAEDADARIRMLASQARLLADRGVQMVIVTSGAIALGTRRLGLAERPRTMPGLQAAAVGQGRLMHTYEQALYWHGLAAGQVLLTHGDIADRRRYLNARHALAELLRLGAVPVINENDTVSTDEIKFGDNDRLAALVATLIDADALLILTDVEGLYDGDPAAGARLIPEVKDIETEARAVAGGSTSGVGTGGMASKVEAARVAGRFGVITVVASGRHDDAVVRLLDEKSAAGTVFWPAVSPLDSRKHWIAFALRPSGSLVVDDGARRALVEGKRSLLASGITAVKGAFTTGEAVSVVGADGQEFARGLCAFDADEVTRIAGHRSNELESLLGYKPAGEVIHRDDLVLL
jgi:glutamate 5-kinase